MDAIPAKNPAIVSIRGFGSVLMSVIAERKFQSVQNLFFQVKPRLMSFRDFARSNGQVFA